ncbi:hypothetical protein [Nocardia sp. NPDC059228]|uniref:hypothetical protein n=1 Tax=Nocardia sp. NPDC059228 TaxID=3346777 RepID=UPI0036C888B8
MELLRRFTSKQYRYALESWAWIGLEGKEPAFASLFGDIFFDSQDGIWVLDLVEGALEWRWDDLEECRSELETAEGQEDWLWADLAQAAFERGLRPKRSEILDFAVPPKIGGELSVDNVHVMDFVTGVGMAGQIHQQLRHVPEGATVQFKMIEPEPRVGWRRWLPGR